MIKNHLLKRVGALAMAAALTLSCGMVSSATNKTVNQDIVDTSKAVTLTIHKYAMEDLDHLGGETDGTTEVKLPEGAVPLDGVGFTLYKVAEGTESTEIPAGAEAAGQGVTGANGNPTGEYKFSDIKQGRYLVVETSVPDKVYQRSDNFLVDLPMCNTTDGEWNYDVHAYPKNAVVEGAVILTKNGENQDALKEATFKLQKKNPAGDQYADLLDNNGKVTTYTTNEKGQLYVKGLIYGDYQFIETIPPIGYGLDETPIKFSITKNGTVDENGMTSGKVEKVTACDKKTPAKPIKTTKDPSESVGKNVTWTITPGIPSDIATYQTYVVTDTFDSRLDYQGVKVFLDGTQINSGFKAAYKSPVAAEGSTPAVPGKLTVDFMDKGILQGKKLTIEVTTTINETAEAAPGYIENTADLTFKNQFGTEGNPTSEPAKTYVGNIEILKYEKQSGKEVGLKGAEFKLYPSLADAKAGKNQIQAVQVTDANGKALFKGLKAGEYWLVESKAPQYQEDGKDKFYTPLSAPQKVVISIGDDNADGITIAKVENKRQAFSLPLTGSTGTAILVFGGLMLISGVTIVFIVRRKRAAI